MPDQYPSGKKFHDTSAIDTRLGELEREKQQLLALREELQASELPPCLEHSHPRTKNRDIQRAFSWPYRYLCPSLAKSTGA